MHQYVVALSTCGSEAEAQNVARALVSEGAAACVTIIAKVTSYYKWKGDLCEESEWLLVIKTTADKQSQIEDLFSRLHSYEVPELIFLPVLAGKKEYLDWLLSAVSAPQR